MNLYFSCSLTGGRRDEMVYALIVEHLKQLGHEVPTAHLADSDVMTHESTVDPDDVYRRDIDWVEACDALVAEVSTPSHGVGYEIAWALLKGKPTLCLYEQGRAVSKMILGNDSPDLVVQSYKGENAVLPHLDQFLSGLEGGRPKKP